MSSLVEEIEEARREALAALAGVADGAGLEEWNREYLGKKGRLTGLFRGVGALAPEERAAAGQAINAAKVKLEEAYAKAQERKSVV